MAEIQKEVLGDYLRALIEQRGLSAIVSILSEISELKGDNLRDAGAPGDQDAPKWYKAAFEIEKTAQKLKDDFKL